MRLKCRVWNYNVPASDGSIIRREVFEDYFRSTEYQESMESGNTLGSLTHRSRNYDSLPEGYGKLKGTIGKDDGMLIVDDKMPAPIYRMTRMYVEGPWVMAELDVFDENTVDSIMAEQIRRFKGLVRGGTMLGLSLVVASYWQSEGGQDIASKIKSIKSCDVTNNPSQRGARILEILEDERSFSDTKTANALSPVIEKTFSDLSSDFPELTGTPKTSKIGGKFTTLKVKSFSCVCEVSESEGPSQKEFSVATVKERVRYAKLSPRQQFRRLLIDYKGAVRAAGGSAGIDEKELKIMKSLFTTVILGIIKQIYPEIMAGKQISTLLGASSLGKNVRVAAQKLQIPFKLSLTQIEKQGFASKDRFTKIQEADRKSVV